MLLISLHIINLCTCNLTSLIHLYPQFLNETSHHYFAILVRGHIANRAELVTVFARPQQQTQITISGLTLHDS